MRTGFALLSLALLALAPAPASAGGPVVLVPHRAVYNLSLLRGGDGSRGIDGAQGRIAFNFGGDACEGYTLQYRQVTVLDSTESGPRTLDVRTATFEGGDGRTMRFKTDSEMGDLPDTDVDGDAELRSGSIAVRLKHPRRETVELPASGEVVFPTEHLKRLIQA